MTKRYGLWSATILTLFLLALACGVYGLSRYDVRTAGTILFSVCALLLLQALLTFNVLEIRGSSQLRLRYFSPFTKCVELSLAELRDVVVIKRTIPGGSTTVKIRTDSGRQLDFISVMMAFERKRLVRQLERLGVRVEAFTL